MKKKNLKIGLIIFLVILMLGITFTSFAFWDQLTKSDDITVNIGAGKEISISFIAEPEEGKTLIPLSSVPGPNDVTEMLSEIKVILNSDVTTPLKLDVTKTQVLIGEQTNQNGLINVGIELEKDYIQYKNEEVIVFVTITLNEPSIGVDYPTAEAAIAAYEAIRNKEVKITLTVTAFVPAP